VLTARVCFAVNSSCSRIVLSIFVAHEDIKGDELRNFCVLMIICEQYLSFISDELLLFVGHRQRCA
jgi:hypothetical protein